MDHDALEAERKRTEHRLERISVRKSELDGRDLLHRVKTEIESEAWYQRLDDLVMPGPGDETWNAELKPLLLEHVCPDLIGIVLGYAKSTVKEACDNILEHMEATSRPTYSETDEKEFTLEIKCFTGYDAITIYAKYTDDRESTDCDVQMSVMQWSRHCEILTPNYIEPVATALRVSGVVPLVVLASILFRPIVAVCREMLLDEAHVSDELDRFVKASSESWFTIRWSSKNNRWIENQEDTSVDQETFECCCGLDAECFY